MSANKERRVKARHDVTQFYQKKKHVSRREIPGGVMTISGDPNPDNSSSSSDDNIEDDTSMPSPRAHPHGKGAARDDEIKEGADGDDGEEEEEVFDVEEINPPNYVDM
jgi:hypothetical protein